jgi:hypothetical protein
MRTARWALIAGILGLGGSLALAQTQALPDTGQEFGSGVNLDVWGFVDFLPTTSDTTYSIGAGPPAGDTRWTTSFGALTAGANRLPNGAYIEGFDVYYYDVSPANNFFFNFCRRIRDTGTGEDPSTTCIATFQSSGTPGNAYELVTIGIEADRTIRYRANWDGDGLIETADYYFSISTGGSDGDVRFASVRARWRRQVSPPPQSATFADVPTNHPFFAFVEALYRSGITAGCGGGNFCPDDPISRGQMAVFLAAALGLHWPSGL